MLPSPKILVFNWDFTPWKQELKLNCFVSLSEGRVYKLEHRATFEIQD